jgi:hypothetical protein
MKHDVVQCLVQLEAVGIGGELRPFQVQVIRESMQQWLREGAEVARC